MTPNAGEDRLDSPKTYLHVSPDPEQHVRSYADTNPAALLRLSSCVLIEAHDEWQDSDRRYLSEESMALLNPPAPTVLTPHTTTPDTTPRKEIADTA